MEDFEDLQKIGAAFRGMAEAINEFTCALSKAFNPLTQTFREWRLQRLEAAYERETRPIRRAVLWWQKETLRAEIEGKWVERLVW